MPDLSSPSPSSERQRMRQLADRGAECPASLSADEVTELCRWLVRIDDEEKDTVLKRRWNSEG